MSPKLEFKRFDCGFAHRVVAIYYYRDLFAWRKHILLYKELCPSWRHANPEIATDLVVNHTCSLLTLRLRSADDNFQVLCYRSTPCQLRSQDVLG